MIVNSSYVVLKKAHVFPFDVIGTSPCLVVEVQRYIVVQDLVGSRRLQKARKDTAEQVQEIEDEEDKIRGKMR